MPDDAASIKTGAVEVKDTRNIHQRLHAVMKEVDYVQKDKKIDAGTRGYMVVTHDAVTSKVRPVLVKHGVMYYPQNLKHCQDGNRTEVSLDVVFVNVNDPQDKVAVPTFGYGIDQGDKGPGKAVSYAVKYALLKALGLETGEDADDAADVKHAPAAETPKNAPGVSKARHWVSTHINSLHAAESPKHLMEMLEEATAMWVRIKSAYPSLWEGPDGSGLRGEAMKCATIYEVRSEFDMFVSKIDRLAKDVQEAA